MSRKEALPEKIKRVSNYVICPNKDKMIKRFLKNAKATNPKDSQRLNRMGDDNAVVYSDCAGVFYPFQSCNPSLATWYIIEQGTGVSLLTQKWIMGKGCV